MALVAYDDSDIEEDEEQDQSGSEQATFGSTTQKDPTQSLLNMLPQPSSKKPFFHEEDDEFLHKKETPGSDKPKVKITVPSLNDFDDVDQKQSKSKVFKKHTSGLLSILPQPKNVVTTKSMIPHSVKQKYDNPVKKKTPQILGNKKPTSTTLQIDYPEDSEDDEDMQNDFFSINKPADTTDVIFHDINEGVSDVINDVRGSSSQRSTPSIESYFKPDVVSLENNEEPQVSHTVDAVAESNDLVLDEEAIVKLCGARGKRKREEIQILEVNQEDVLKDARELLLKGLMDDTSKRVSSSKRRGNEPTSIQKRKHQITYLAHQAKANEAELQNQWANNRMTRRQTQSKYGF